MTEPTQPCLLAIESDQKVRKLLRKSLQGLDLVFSSPSDDLPLDTKVPDIVLIGADLPGVDGFRICKLLASNRQTQDIPIVFLAASDGQMPEFDPHRERVVVLDDLTSLPQRLGALARKARLRKLVRDAVENVVNMQEGAPGLSEHDVRVLESGGFVTEAEPDPTPFAQAAAMYDAILASSLSVTEAAKRLGVTEGRVRQRLGAAPAELYGVRRGKSWKLPAFQFDKRGLVHDIDKVIARLDPNLNPVAVERFFRSPSVDLERGSERLSPLSWLALGEPWQVVAELAEDL